ncbi:MAG TPA: hypothetical protein VMW24_10710 [Sedimentisphaerales bacterium]|nr:hypothetical protein [Sedimentisphaerales bacterium]
MKRFVFILGMSLLITNLILQPAGIRTGFAAEPDAEIEALRAELTRLQAENQELREKADRLEKYNQGWHDWYVYLTKLCDEHGIKYTKAPAPANEDSQLQFTYSDIPAKIADMKNQRFYIRGHITSTSPIKDDAGKFRVQISRDSPWLNSSKPPSMIVRKRIVQVYCSIVLPEALALELQKNVPYDIIGTVERIEVLKHNGSSYTNITGTDVYTVIFKEAKFY